MHRRSSRLDVLSGWRVLIVVAFGVSATHTRAGADAPADRYTVDAPGGLVTDERTGLVWQHPPAAIAYTWEEARVYCSDLRLARTGGFRVPTLKELLTLVDPVRIGPAIDLTAFPSTPSDWFWTASTRHASGPAAVSFQTGETTFFALQDPLRVRCVR